MEKNDALKLPELILLEQFGGDFNIYLEEVYSIFKKDFVDSKLKYRGIRLGLKKHPKFKGKEATFWHITSEGEENNRIPDLRRLERIRWIAELIKKSEHPYLKVWENRRKNKNNILIFHEQQEYLVVLRKVNNYILPWTAYLINDKARKKKLLKEYEDFINAKSI